MSDSTAVLSVATAQALQALGARLGRDAAAWCKENGRGLVIGLRGGLGAGKTTFVQGLVAGLPGGGATMATSPTYALIHAYPTDPPVAHLDLYRLDSEEALWSIGYRDLLASPGLVLVEWIDRVPGALPAEGLLLDLQVAADDTRLVTVEAHGPRVAGLAAALAGST